MALVNAKCTNCNMELLIDDEKDADICPNCNTAFVAEKAIKLYNSNGPKEDVSARKRRHRWRSLGRGLLLALECIGYLIYVVCFLWLFFDIVDGVKKK